MRIDLARKIEWPVLTLTYLLAVVGTLLLMSNIAGPFIFLDELEYHLLAQAIYKNFEFSGRQYNPLYPLLIAPTFGFSESESHYLAIKFINAFTWCSIIFPSYLLACEIVKSRKVAFFLSLLTVVTPIGAYSHLIWAESLYYPLICWSIYFIYRWLDDNRLQDGVLAGIALGLSFLTKQAAIFLAIALYATLLFQHISKRGKAKLQPNFWIVLLTSICIASPWIIRNKLIEGGTVGYSAMFDLLITAASTPIPFLQNLMKSIGYSIGYWFASYFGLGLILLCFTTLHTKDSTESDRKIVLFSRVIVIFSLLLGIMNSAFLVAYGHNHMSNGRYVDTIYPIVVILIAWQAKRNNVFIHKGILLLIAVLALITFIASPLDQLSANSMINSSGISYLHSLFNWGGPFRWSEVPADMLSRGCLATGLFLISLIVFMENWKAKISLVGLLCLIIGGFAHYYVIRVGESANPTNTFMKKVASKGVDQREIAFDNALKGSSISYYYNFWLSRRGHQIEASYAEPSDLIETYKISFGVKDGDSVDKDTMKVWAPWNPQSGYRAQIGIGFSDISSITAGKCHISKERAQVLRQNSQEFVLSKNKAEYSIHLAPGRYRVTGLSADARCIGAEVTAYSVSISGSTQKGFVVQNEQEWSADFVVTEGDPVARITLSPLEGTIWTLDNIKIHNLDRIHNDFKSNMKYLVSYKLLPREIIVESNGIYLYRIS